MTTQAGKAPVRAGRARKRLSPSYVPYLFLLPALALLVWFRYTPAFSAIYHSFTDWSGSPGANFVGLEQYRALLQDEVFLLSLRNIFIYTLARTVIATVMALLGAELIYNLRSFQAASFWRMVFTVPLVIPASVVFLVWQRIYAGRLGLLNEFLDGVGLSRWVQPWLGQTDTALLALIMIGFPLVTGVAFLVLLAALQNLPSSIGEAALLDGCSGLRRVFAIDLPSIRGPLALVIILGINAGLQEFAPMLIVTGGGGPINATQSPGLYLYQQAISYGKYGYATAIGTVLMLLTLAFSWFILRSRYRGAHDVAI